MKFSRQQVLILSLLFTVTLLNYFDRQILSILVPVLRRDLGMTVADYARATNAFLLAYGLMYLGSGVVLDRIGSRAGLTLFVVAWSVACGLHAAAGGALSFVVFRFLLGIFEPGGWTGSIKTISERYSAVQRGLAAGIFASGSSVATLITPPLVVAITLHFGWRMSFVIPALLGLLWAPLWLAVTRTKVKSLAEPAIPIVEQLALLRNRRVLAYVLVRFFGDSSGYFFLFWIPDYLTSVKHFSFVMLGTLAWIPYAANDLGPVTGGYLASWLVRRGWDPLPARRAVMTCASVVVATGAVSLFGNRPLTVLVPLSIASFAVGVWAGNMHGLPADAFPQKIVSTAYGLAGSAGAIGGIVFNSLTAHFSGQAEYGIVFLLLTLTEPLGAAAMWLLMK